MKELRFLLWRSYYRRPKRPMVAIHHMTSVYGRFDRNKSRYKTSQLHWISLISDNAFETFAHMRNTIKLIGNGFKLNHCYWMCYRSMLKQSEDEE